MLFSIVTVCLNSEKTILKSLKSLHDQTERSFEHIVIDGNSSDNTLNILRAHSGANTKIVSEKDDGIYSAINKGIKMCTGEYVYLLHSDDILYSNTILEQAVKHIFLNDKPDIIAGSTIVVNDLERKSIGRLNSSRYFKKWMLRLGMMPAHNACFVKRQLYEKSLYDETYISAGDFEWFVRINTAPTLRFIATSEIFCAQLSGGTSTTGIRSWLRSTREQGRAFKENRIWNLNFLFLCRFPIKLCMLLLRKCSRA